MKSKEKEEDRLKEGLSKEIKSILGEKGKLILTFIAENPFWSPGLQIITEIDQLGKYVKEKDIKEEKVYKYPSGLILKNYLYDNFNISKEDDGVFCIFDARSRTQILQNWREIVIKIIEAIEEKKVVLIGIRVNENADWSSLLEQFNINEYLENKMISLLFFKIGNEYRLEIFDQLKVMFSSIVSLL